jgi:hypothetical protein
MTAWKYLHTPQFLKFTSNGLYYVLNEGWYFSKIFYIRRNLRSLKHFYLVWPRGVYIFPEKSLAELIGSLAHSLTQESSNCYVLCTKWISQCTTRVQCPLPPPSLYCVSEGPRVHRGFVEELNRILHVISFNEQSLGICALGCGDFYLFWKNGECQGRNGCHIYEAHYVKCVFCVLFSVHLTTSKFL